MQSAEDMSVRGKSDVGVGCETWFQRVWRSLPPAQLATSQVRCQPARIGRSLQTVPGIEARGVLGAEKGLSAFFLQQ